MSTRREERICAMQVLFQLDAHRKSEDGANTVSLDGGGSPGTAELHRSAIELAHRVWQHRADADREIGALSVEWPVHRQAGVDRSLLRLGWYELRIARTPAGLCINDIVEIAKEYSSEKSASFVNALLDQVAKAEPSTPEAQP